MKKGCILLLAACLLLAGCGQLPSAREMGDMALLRTMGIDVAPGGVTVTGSTGPRAKGIQAEDEPALVLSAARESLSGACLAMQGQSDSYVFFGYVDQLLIGGELAEQGIRPVLDYFARDVELGLGAQLWLVQGAAAGEAVAAGGDEGVDSRLETLRNDSEMGIAALTRTAGEVYTDLLELGSSFVPALSPVGDETAVLTERGYGILRGDALAGFLEGEAAKGLELLAGGPAADILVEELSDQKVSVKITSAHTQSRLEFQGDTPFVLKLTCKVEARLSEYRRRLEQEGLEQLKAGLEAREQARLALAMEQLQALGTDCAGLGAKAGMFHPAKWQAVREDWPEWFGRVPVEIQVEVKIL
ncbi:Ger(x)C family spore germination C-terminal domain-containing protein [Flintibacter muris]|uniref:Ger(x)C family spore germination C-terminal domain-containing protein n=1 Tax=Flintibacter muris TaxID=2941327 RepID=UPI00203CB065|nr:Ger(x)C family spore germination C-terminal domain-containing protein [Flintibacter muris]